MRSFLEYLEQAGMEGPPPPDMGGGGMPPDLGLGGPPMGGPPMGGMGGPPMGGPGGMPPDMGPMGPMGGMPQQVPTVHPEPKTIWSVWKSILGDTPDKKQEAKPTEEKSKNLLST